MTASLRHLGILLASSCLLMACPGQPEEGETPQPQGEAASAIEAAASAPGPDAPRDLALSPEDLSPRFQGAGPTGIAPERFVVQLRYPVFQDLINSTWSPDGRYPLPDGFRADISPALEGSWFVTSDSNLTFFPSEGLAPTTTYQLRIEAIPHGEKSLGAPDDGSWTGEVKTPAFAFHALSLESLDPRQGLAQLRVVFTFPVDLNEVARRMEVRLGGANIQAPMERTSSANALRLTLRDPRLGRQDLNASVTIASGVPLPGSDDVSALGGVKESTISARGGLEIVASRRKEAGTGHYIEIYCRDDEAPGEERWFWDRETYDSYELSSRCVLDPDIAQEVIHFDPPVDFYTARSEAGFRIFGDFERRSYGMKIDPGAVSIDGGYLRTPYETSFEVPARSPTLSFIHKGRYLPKAAWQDVAISHLNVPNVKLTIRHIPPENLTFWLGGDDEAATSRTSNVVLSKTIPLKSPEDKAGTSSIPVGDLLPNPTRGVYELRIEGAGKVDAARLLLTDINLIAKAVEPAQGAPWPGAYHVWAVGMEDLKPLSGVRVRALRPSGMVMASCFTDDSGGCRLSLPEPGVDRSPPFAVIATRGNDLTYLSFDELRVSTAEEQVSGLPYGGAQAYSASIYSDRGVYRPGESIHLGMILRDKEGVAPPKGMPMKLEVLGPRQSIIKSIPLETNSAGMAVADVTFAAFADTGRYQAQLSVAGAKIGSYRFSVEEFMPERMAVVARADKSAYLAGEAPGVEIDAQYLFGGSASGSPAELRCFLEPGRFKPERNGEYTYGVWSGAEESKGAVALGTSTGELGEDGILTLPCPGGEGVSVIGPGELRAEAAVFEAGSGRSTTATARAPIHPAPFYIGMKTGAETTRAGQAFDIEGIVVDWEGRVVKDAPQSLEVRLFHIEAEYSWGYWDEYGDETFERELRLVPEGKRQVQVKDGRFRLTVTPESAPEGFLVQVSTGNARGDLMVEGQGGGYYFGHGSRRVDQTPKPSRPGTLALKVGAVRVGASVPVSFDAPYRGRVLLTVETDSILTQAWKDVEPGPVEWQFTLPKFTPNVYVSALLLKDPHLDSPDAFKPDRAFGVTSATVEPEAFRETLRLEVPKEVRSNSTLEVKVSLGAKAGRGPTFVTVAAVDEGILSLTKFESPDPFKAIFAQRALGVATYETIGWSLLVPPSGPSSSTGGGAGEAPGRVQPVKPVALWSGMVEVPESGEVSINFDVPQYRGALRVMAVAATPTTMAHSDAKVLVRDPLVLQTTLPRFMVEGDVADIPVFLTNLTGATQDINITLNAEALPMAGLSEGLGSPSPLSFVGGKAGRIRLEDGAAGTVVFKVRGTQTVGAARLRVEAKAGEFVSYEDLVVPFSPAGPRVRRVQQISLKPGKNDLTQHLTGWVPTTETSTIWVTANPFAESFDHLKYLIRYPYGCIEQTTSSTRPLLFVSNLLKNVDPEAIAERRIEPMILSGLDRIISMQTPSGGFAYWPGGSYISPWAHAYATHLLLDAKALQYPVPKVAVDQAISWIERNLNAMPSGHEGRSLANAEAYLHYVLAKAGKGRKARVASLLKSMKTPKTGHEKENRYLLMAALYLSGDQSYEVELRNVDTSPIQKRERYYYNYYSDLRRRALTLAVFQDLFKQDAAGLALAKVVARDLAGRRSAYYTTQELTWGVTALGRWVGSNNKAFKPPTLEANGGEVRSQGQVPKDDAGERTFGLYRASEYDRLTIDMPRFKDQDIVAVISSEGVRKGEGYELGGEGLSLKRVFYSPDGEPLSLAAGSLELGDLVYVMLELKNTTGQELQNIALVDRLPAGFEIENPRLGRGGAVEWMDESRLWSADHMNLRDDRVEVFGTLGAGQTQAVLYAVRAVTAGQYVLPPASAEGMYDPELWSRVGGGTVVIEGPWAGLYL